MVKKQSTNFLSCCMKMKSSIVARFSLLVELVACWVYVSLFGLSPATSPHFPIWFSVNGNLNFLNDNDNRTHLDQDPVTYPVTWSILVVMGRLHSNGKAYQPVQSPTLVLLLRGLRPPPSKSLTRSASLRRRAQLHPRSALSSETLTVLHKSRSLLVCHAFML